MNKHLKQFGIVIAGTVLTKIAYDAIGGDQIAENIRRKVKSAYRKFKKSDGGNLPGI